MKLIIYGAGGEGRVILRLAREINNLNSRWDEILFVDDVTNEREISGCRVFPFDEIIKRYDSNDTEVVISLGEPKHRLMLYNKVIEAGYNLCAPISMNIENVQNNKLNKGVILTYDTKFGVDNTISENTIIEGAIITHDVTIGKHCFICSGVVVGGLSSIDDGTFIGLNASVRDRIHIGSNVIVGMSACVVNDIPDNVIVTGNPAKIAGNSSNRKVFK